MKTECRRNACHVRDTRESAIDDGPSNWLPLNGVSLEQLLSRAALEHQRHLPGQVERVSDRRVEPQPVGRWMPVPGVTHDRRAARAVDRRDLMVDLPHRHSLEGYFDRRISDDLVDSAYQ